MNVAIFSPYATVIPHFETELDIAQQHLDQGDHVEFFNCLGQLSNCDFNVDRVAERCEECIGRRTMGLELLKPNVGCQSFETTELPDSIRTDFESVEDLINYRIEDFDIGYAVLSSLVSIIRDPEPDLSQHTLALTRFITSAYQGYTQTIEFISKKESSGNRLDRVYIYNGRFAAMRAVFRACQKMGVDCYLHERGCDGKHYELLKNHLPHDITMIQKAIEASWANAESNPERENIAASWFHDRVNRVEKAWHSFVKDQESGRLPANFDSSQKNISIFCSSDDEFVAIGKEWANEMYPNQVTAIESIANELLQREPETKIFVRVHPNLKGVENERMCAMMSISIPNVSMIAPEATIDTYELMRQSDIVVSFGSSVGSEAVFWGKPSVLLGPCFYENLGGVYRSRSHDDTIALLTSELKPQEKLGALKYGYWFQTRGFAHKFFEATGLFEGKFKGQVVYARPIKKRLPLRKKIGNAFSKIWPVSNRA